MGRVGPWALGLAIRWRVEISGPAASAESGSLGEHWGRMAVCECYLQDKVLAAPLLRLYV